jgi:hypothetical protein
MIVTWPNLTGGNEPAHTRLDHGPSFSGPFARTVKPNHDCQSVLFCRSIKPTESNVAACIPAMIEKVPPRRIAACRLDTSRRLVPPWSVPSIRLSYRFFPPARPCLDARPPVARRCLVSICPAPARSAAAENEKDILAVPSCRIFNPRRSPPIIASGLMFAPPRSQTNSAASFFFFSLKRIQLPAARASLTLANYQ